MDDQSDRKYHWTVLRGLRFLQIAISWFPWILVVEKSQVGSSIT